MVCLLRHFIIKKPPVSGFDVLPPEHDTTPADDLVRIKYYRNYVSHLHDGQIDDVNFKSIWNELCVVCNTYIVTYSALVEMFIIKLRYVQFFLIVCLYMYCRWRSSYEERVVGIQLTGLSPPHICACPTPEPRSQMSYVVVYM